MTNNVKLIAAASRITSATRDELQTVLLDLLAQSPESVATAMRVNDEIQSLDPFNQEIIQILKAGGGRGFVDAIKHHRIVRGSALKEAKEEVDRIRERYAPEMIPN